jgi:hypothetical protein
MTRLRSLLHPFGWGALVGGVIVATVGLASGDELGGLAWSYGVLVVLAAAYLIAGLHIRTAVATRRTSPAKTVTGRHPEASGA